MTTLFRTTSGCEPSRHTRRWLCVVLWLFVASLPGCSKSSGPELVPVHGNVTSNGKPVPGLFITFLPETGRPSWAMTDDSGEYEANYNTSEKGVQQGECKVWVTFKPKTVEQEMAMLKGENPFAEWAELLKKYGSERTSPLRVTVSAEEARVDLQLD